jgi:hypothetical protein
VPCTQSWVVPWPSMAFEADRSWRIHPLAKTLMGLPTILMSVTTEVRRHRYDVGLRDYQGFFTTVICALVSRELPDESVARYVRL